MDLVQALRLPFDARLALVGAGGKSTALFSIARQLQQNCKDEPVLVTASTHLSVEQAAWGDQHILLSSPIDVSSLAASLHKGVIVLTGPEVEIGRLAGLDPVILAQVAQLAGNRHWPLLVEADGSRLHPLKAPASHEPAIPPFVSHVLVVVGLSALGQSLDADWVHRPELFSELSSLPMGAALTPQALTTVLMHPSGGLKNIPANAQRIVLLNQADTAVLQAQGGELAERLLASYHAVLIASLGGETPAEVLAAYEPVAGILLAAGEGRRFLESAPTPLPKPLLPWQGKTLIFHTARTALDAGLSPVIVVSGAATAGIRRSLADLPVQLVHNPDWQAGLSTSIQAAMRALPAGVASAIFLHADQPFVSPSLLRALKETHARSLPPVVAPLVDGQRGNPVLFDRATFKDFSALRGDVGGRQLFSRYPVTWLPWHNSQVLADIDTWADYQNLLSREGG